MMSAEIVFHRREDGDDDDEDVFTLVNVNSQENSPPS